MLKSMTGFGRATAEENGYVVIAEIKTLNSKQTDIYCRLPRSISAKEIEIRNKLSQELERGKIELNISIQKTIEKEVSVQINRPLVAAYVKDIIAAGSIVNANISPEKALSLALSMPNAYNSDAAPDAITEKEWEVVQKALTGALLECNEFRIREGELLVIKFSEYISSITNNLAEVEIKDKARIPLVRERLRKAVADMVADEAFDKNRFEQEMVYFIEKYDIAEEKQRLSTHLKYFLEILKNEGNGKKLSFMAQELGREINTIGSKANDVELQHLVVNMKEELEKIKEQTANVF